MSEGLRMVYLRTVPDAWHAKVLAARLGAEGIVTHLQGPVSGPYPFGAVAVHVEAAQADLAADLLLADEVESAFNCCSVLGGDDILPSPRLRPAEGVEVMVTPEDDLDLRPFDGYGSGPSPHRPVSRKLRAVAAFAALMVAGAPVLAHFMT
jgi:hypothetical protein